MHIQELIIDGFKSYAQRTVITGWDRHFNAITGLNGTGKSNILDAICFVLGIENLRHVRAQHLHDLIYKKGQAGVTRASVTLVFDNSDSEASPVGFKDCQVITVTRQIALGGKNRYLINGHLAQQKSVENLFQSVQLNVNNPHFLIMQGRITKVLNMKAPEILAMIEETAGTRMFEDRKLKALATMEKKERKVEEITALLQEMIIPKLDKLRQERTAFLEFQKTEMEVDRIRRLLIAADYVKHQEKFMNAEKELAEKGANVTKLQSQVQALKEQKRELELEFKEAQHQRNIETNKNSNCQKLENQVKELSKQLVKIKTQLDLKRESAQEEEKRAKQWQKQCNEAKKVLEQKKQEYEQFEKEFNKEKETYHAEQAKVSKTEDLIQTLSTGLSQSNGTETGFAEQIKSAKAAMMQAKTETEQSKLQLTHLKRSLKEKLAKSSMQNNDNSDLESAYKQASESLTSLQKEYAALNYSQEEEMKSVQAYLAKESEVSQLQQKLDQLESQSSHLSFTFANPSPNFDRSQVHGLIAQLFQLDSRTMQQYATALEVTAGGKLFHVVVTDEQVASQLIERGRLQKRVTIIPLNKIQPYVLDAQRLEIAKSLGKDSQDVYLALELIQFPEQDTAAMQFVFGATLICRDKETAQKVTFDRRVQCKSVTWEGDVYDPAGTLTGGSQRNQQGSVLQQWAQLHELKLKVEQAKSELQTLNEIKTAYRRKSEMAKQLSQQLDLKRHELKLLQQQLDQSLSSQNKAECDTMQEQITQLEEFLVQSNDRMVKLEGDYQQIVEESKDFEKNRSSKLTGMQKQLVQDKKSLQRLQEQFTKKQQKLQELEQQLVEGQEEVETLNQSLSSLTETHQEESQLEQELASLQSQYNPLADQLLAARAAFNRLDEQCRELEKNIAIIEKQSNQLELSLKESTHFLQNQQRDLDQSQIYIKKLEQENAWILEQKNTFSKLDWNLVSQWKQQLTQLESCHAVLRKTINVQVMDMMDRVEKKEASLKSMLSTVKRDKQKIEKTIETLDEYKRETLERTWRKVDKDFGAIFGDLLPGNNAKLVPPEGQSWTQGLEVRVCLGNVWKPSLTELSGGQRSLIALSLILALLQYRPAPMYILDEVDAALDLSHTQHIGQLFQQRFKGAQFIVVSLKEGLFQNANVLFRTRFRDGVSHVERWVHGEQEQQQETERTSTKKSTKLSQQRSLPAATVA